MIADQKVFVIAAARAQCLRLARIRLGRFFIFPIFFRQSQSLEPHGRVNKKRLDRRAVSLQADIGGVFENFEWNPAHG